MPPFYLTEYKFNEESLGLSNNRTKALNCTINKGETVNISLQSTTLKQSGSAVYLPFRLYLDFDKVFGGYNNSSATVNTSNVSAKLVDTDKPTIQSVTAPGGNLCQRTARAHHSYL